MGDYGSKDKIQLQLPILTNPDETPVLPADHPLNNGGFFTSGPIETLRTQHAAAEEENYLTTPTLGTHESTGHIRMRDGYPSKIRIFRPSCPSTTGSPLIVLIFGGGYLVGTNMQHAPFARALTALYNATTITISYRLAPQYPFPTGAQDVWDSVSWIAEHATLLGADPTAGFILGGVSAGGHLTTLTAQRAVSENLQPPLTGLWISVPVTTLTADGIPERYRDIWTSRTENANAPILNMADINFAEEQYKPDTESDWFNPYAHPQAARGFPKSYFQVVELDPLRDDGIVFERYLRDSGVETRLDFYRGVPHCHYAFYPELKASRVFRRDVVVKFGWLLNREVSEGEIVRVVGNALMLEEKSKDEGEGEGEGFSLGRFLSGIREYLYV
ncbi:Alpha/Beta hydrolase protein [Aspergillus karnatakaensis]|uniref:alpha/beta hydrolase n=1 Tax=Aspergillus karnatakaensis TaxID=1810916 RepID=UPI003CCD2AC5